MGQDLKEAIDNWAALYVVWFAVVHFLYLGVCSHKKRDVAKLYILIAYGIYLFAVFNREIDYGVGGIDAINYKRYFELASSMPYREFMEDTGKEWGIWTIFWLFYQIVPDYQIFISVLHSVAFVLCVECLKNIKLEKRGIIGWLFVFLFTLQLFYMFNILRTGLAVYLGTMALICAMQGKSRESLLYAVIAIEIHRSAFPVLIATVIFYLRQSGFRIKTMYWVVAGLVAEGILLFYFSNHPISGSYAFYNTFQKGAMAWGRCAAILLGLLVARYGQAKEMLLTRNSAAISMEDVLLTSLLIVPMNTMFAISNRMYMVYLPVIYMVFYYGISCNLSFAEIRRISLKKMVTAGALLFMLMDFFRFALVIIPQSMGKFNIVL